MSAVTGREGTRDFLYLYVEHIRLFNVAPPPARGRFGRQRIRGT